VKFTALRMVRMRRKTPVATELIRGKWSVTSSRPRRDQFLESGGSLSSIKGHRPHFAESQSAVEPSVGSISDQEWIEGEKLRMGETGRGVTCGFWGKEITPLKLEECLFIPGPTAEEEGKKTG